MTGTDNNNIILKRKVLEWVKAGNFVDAHSEDFSRPEVAELFRLVRNMFGPGSRNFSDDRLREIQNDLREESAIHQDEFGTNLRSFSGIISQIIKSPDAFRNELAQNTHTLELGGTPTNIRVEPKASGDTEKTTKKVTVNGNIWEGYFKGNTPVDKGTIHYPDGIVYQGQWSEYGPDGDGRLLSGKPDGWILCTKFRKGKVSGPLTLRWKNGDFFVTDPVIPTSKFGDIARFSSGVYHFSSREQEPGRFVDGKWHSGLTKPQPTVVRKLFSAKQIAIIVVSAIITLGVAGWWLK